MAPLAGANPAPCHHVGQCEQQFLVGALVVVVDYPRKPVATCSPGTVVERGLVGAHERVVLFDHQVRIATGVAPLE